MDKECSLLKEASQNIRLNRCQLIDIEICNLRLYVLIKEGKGRFLCKGFYYTSVPLQGNTKSEKNPHYVRFSAFMWLFSSRL